MSNYRRAYQKGGCYFFTVVTHARRPLLTLPGNLPRLRRAFRQVKTRHPFTLDGIVVLPDHLHCLMRLPAGDDDFSLRWRLIKRHFSAGIDAPKNHRGEKAVWQRRFWEHLIRDEVDWRRHLDYIHFNPVKHGLVTRPADWPWGTFARAVVKGWYAADWAGPVEGCRDLVDSAPTAP